MSKKPIRLAPPPLPPAVWREVEDLAFLAGVICGNSQAVVHPDDAEDRMLRASVSSSPTLPVIVGDVHTDPRVPEFYRRHALEKGWRFRASIPLLGADSVLWGVLSLSNTEPVPITPTIEGALRRVVSSILARLEVERGLLRLATDAMKEHETHEERHRESAQQGRLQANIIDSTNDVIFAKDKGGFYIFSNRTARELVGLTQGQLETLTAETLFGAEEGARIRETDERVMRTGETLVEEQSVQVRGVERHFIVTKFPMRDAADEVIGVVAICRDVTQMRRLEEDNRRIESRWRRTVAVIDDGLLMFDGAAKLIGCNPGAEHLLGASFMELAGVSMKSMFGADGSEALLTCADPETVGAGAVWLPLETCLESTGEIRHVNARAALADEKAGPSRGLDVFIRQRVE